MIQEKKYTDTSGNRFTTYSVLPPYGVFKGSECMEMIEVEKEVLETLLITYKALEVILGESKMIETLSTIIKEKKETNKEEAYAFSILMATANTCIIESYEKVDALGIECDMPTVLADRAIAGLKAYNESIGAS